jgi:hypothetical protein
MPDIIEINSKKKEKKEKKEIKEIKTDHLKTKKPKSTIKLKKKKPTIKKKKKVLKKKTKERVMVSCKKRIVYLGIRGGKYVKIKGKFVSIKKAKKYTVVK